MYNTDMPTRAELPTTRQLLRSTAIAIAAAAVLLVTVVLPSEYGVDPTGVGRVLGLTEMGEIKQQLAAEASAEEEASLVTAEVSADAATAEIALPAATAPEAAASETATGEWRDTVTLTLAPGEAAEVKLSMKKDEVATYEWSVSQGHVNSDLHADGAGGLSTSYRKGRAESRDAGDLKAAFDGSHGWFWRNRSDVPVELTLQTNGAYSAIKRVI
jgi:hypothetical protein